jgi:hypothetical protein
MKSLCQLAGAAAAIIATLTLTGCATGQDEHRRHHPEPTAAGPAGERMGMMDKDAMCDMHQQMMAAKTPEERKAMMDEHIKKMSPEMREKHEAMMQKKCP